MQKRSGVGLDHLGLPYSWGCGVAYILGLMRPRAGSRYGPFVTWRAVVVDVVAAFAAFGLSAAVLAGSVPVAAELREPDAFAYVLLAVYSLSPILRRRSPVIAVLGGLAAGLV